MNARQRRAIEEARFRPTPPVQPKTELVNHLVGELLVLRGEAVIVCHPDDMSAVRKHFEAALAGLDAPGPVSLHPEDFMPRGVCTVVPSEDFAVHLADLERIALQAKGAS